MAYNDLREFLKVLEKEGELQRIDVPVSTDLEIAEITDRISKSPEGKNKALLFTNVKGYDMPVLINAFGSTKRMNLALEVDNLDEIADRIRKLVKPKVPETIMAKMAMLPTLMEVGQFPPKVTRMAAPCQEVVVTDPTQAMLDKLPVIKCWPLDAGDFITLPVVITKDPKSGIRNVAIYRLQRYDNTTTGMHWHKHHDGARHFEDSRRDSMESAHLTGKGGQAAISFRPSDEETGRLQEMLDSIGNAARSHAGANPSPSYQPEEPPNYGTFFDKSQYEKPGNRLEVAVALGCDPAITYAASAPLPPDIDEMVFAGFLRKSPVKLVKCVSVDLEVPAAAEIVIEGYVDQQELKEEGPFGDHTGFYSLAGLFPVFHVTAVTHRRSPIYQTTIVGKPPQEDCYLGKATERIFLPMVQLLVPEIVDMNLPWEGVFHNCAIISIDKRYPGHARKVMAAVWGLGQLMFTKFVIIVDKDINVQNLSEVALNVFGNCDPKRDTMFVDGPLDILDHACPILGYGSKVGIDATRKWRSEGFNRDWPRELTMSEDIKSLVTQRWHDYGF
ncbi:MAG: UbiD family decarboxylase [Candidatus Obscuribacterales bacterium]|nr:UbiD family decarboxylase [Candidatus Obscuribacterales bacterium]